jgi:multiple sugar transport system permease protein
MTTTAASTTTPSRTATGETTRTGRRRPSARRTWGRIALYGTLIIGALMIVLPLLWILLTSFKTDSDAIDNPASPLPNPFSIDAYQTLTNGQQPILTWFLNSLAAGALQTVLILVTASMGAYALARLEFPGKKIVFGAIVLTLFVPPVIFLIPNYLLVQNFGWLDTIWAITIPGAAGAFGIFFLRQFFINLPPEIEEAARLDGAGDIRIFTQIILPLSRPAIATLAVLSFLSNWNDFLWPVYVLLSPAHQTLQPGLAVLQGAYSTHYAIVMAGAVVASVPVLILFTLAQRQLVESVAASGLKG